MTPLVNLVVPHDLVNLNVSDIRSIAKQFGMKKKENTRRESIKITNKISNMIEHPSNKVLNVLSGYLDKLFIKGNVSWFKLNPKYLVRLKGLIRNAHPNLFNNSRIIPNNLDGSPFLFGISDFTNYVKNGYILRYVYSSGNSSTYLNGRIRLIPRIHYINVIIVPNKGLIEIRANSDDADVILDSISKYYKGVKLQITPVSIGGKNLFEQAVKQFLRNFGGKLSGTKTHPHIPKNMSISKSDTIQILNIIRLIDDRMKGTHVNVNGAIDKLNLSKNVSFPVLMLSGLKSVGIKSSQKVNLATTLFYSTFKNYSDAKTDIIKIKIANKVYYVKLSKESVDFYKKSNEKLVSIIRDNLIL